MISCQYFFCRRVVTTELVLPCEESARTPSVLGVDGQEEQLYAKNTHIGSFGTTACLLCRLSVGYVQNHTRGIYPEWYPANKFWKFCKTCIPVPGTSVSSVRPWPQYLRDGYSSGYDLREHV